MHGQPKKLASLKLETRGDLIVAEVERNGITILTATLPYKQRAVDPAQMRRHFDFTENINYKLIPSIDGTPAIRQLTARRLTDVAVKECWIGPCTVELRPNAQAPVWRLPVIEPLEGFFWRADFTLVAGRVRPRLPRGARSMSGRLVVLDASFGDVSVESEAAAPYGVSVEDAGGVTRPGGRGRRPQTPTACSSNTACSTPRSSSSARAGA